MKPILNSDQVDSGVYVAGVGSIVAKETVYSVVVSAGGVRHRGVLSPRIAVRSALYVLNVFAVHIRHVHIRQFLIQRLNPVPDIFIMFNILRS